MHPKQNEKMCPFGCSVYSRDSTTKTHTMLLRHWIYRFTRSFWFNPELAAFMWCIGFFKNCLTRRRIWMLLVCAEVVHAILAVRMDPCTSSKTIVILHLNATYLSITRHDISLVSMKCVMVPYRQILLPRKMQQYSKCAGRCISQETMEICNSCTYSPRNSWYGIF